MAQVWFLHQNCNAEHMYLQPHSRQWGFWQCFPFSWTTLRGKHCRQPTAVIGVEGDGRQQQKNGIYRRLLEVMQSLKVYLFLHQN